jgi:acyl-CoA synthetase (AMP-forming)/AMP-acid ligase II
MPKYVPQSLSYTRGKGPGRLRAITLWEHFGISEAEAQLVLGHGPLVPYRDGTVGVAWGANVQEVAEALSGRIAAFKFPHQVFVPKEMLKNANGKTQRSAVIKLLVEKT